MKRVLLAAAVLALATTALVALLAHALLQPVPGRTAPVVVEIAPGTSPFAIARQLEEARAIRSALAFLLLARARGDDARLRSGEYEIAPEASAAGVLTQITEGRVLVHEVVVPEGLTLVQIAARLADARLADAAAFEAVARDPEVARAFGVEGDTLEGYLFPETYHFAKGLPPREIAQAMVEHFLSLWRELEPAAKARGLGMRQLVTLASIVEKETGAPDERPLIASVFTNRLARGMRLETDPTVIYGIEGFDGNLRRQHLEDDANPYNTYRIAGLPPGPIANPGAASLRAAARPADTDYLYFVSRNDGTHQFSRTYAEHLRAVSRYQLGGRRSSR